MKHKPIEILITNDDGYTSKGINFLATLLEEHGNVTVVAPDVVQSGMSAALSMGRTLRLEKKSQTVGTHGNSITVYSLTGTPVDCVKMARNKIGFRPPTMDFRGTLEILMEAANRASMMP